MATATRVPLEVYLSNMCEPDADFVDGCIEERPMGQFDHASWQQAIQHWFLVREKEWNVRVRPELRIQTTRTNYRVADVVVFSRNNPIEQILTLPPIAVFEILSPDDRLSRLMLKLNEYEAMGIPTVLLIEPESKQVSQYLTGELHDVTGTVQQLSGSPCFIDWNKVEELLD